MSKTFCTKAGKEFIVDDEDYLVVMGYSWRCCKGYITTRRQEETISLHRLLIGAKEGEIVDHIDGNKRNNQKTNLRICTAKQNSINHKLCSARNYRQGVRLSRGGLKWEAYVKIRKDLYNLGRYNTETEARVAYNEVAKTLHGEYARLYAIKEEQEKHNEEE